MHSLEATMSNGHDASRSHFKLKSIYILTIVATTIDDDCLKLPALQCQIEHWRLMVSIFGENTAALRRDGSPPHRQAALVSRNPTKPEWFARPPQRYLSRAAWRARARSSRSCGVRKAPTRRLRPGEARVSLLSQCGGSVHWTQTQHGSKRHSWAVPSASMRRTNRPSASMRISRAAGRAEVRVGRRRRARAPPAREIRRRAKRRRPQRPRRRRCSHWTHRTTGR